MTTDTQTAAPQEAATSIHEPMETVSQHQRTLFRIREEQKADRRAAKMQEKQSVRQALRTGRDVPQQKRTIISRKAYRRSI